MKSHFLSLSSIVNLILIEILLGARLGAYELIHVTPFREIFMYQMNCGRAQVVLTTNLDWHKGLVHHGLDPGSLNNQLKSHSATEEPAEGPVALWLQFATKSTVSQSFWWSPLIMNPKLSFDVRGPSHFGCGKPRPRYRRWGWLKLADRRVKVPPAYVSPCNAQRRRHRLSIPSLIHTPSTPA